MKKKSSVFTEIVKMSAESALKRDANNTTCCAIYQPKAPATLKKFSKVENDK